jgi:TRAP-type C4-dicarboxylate transport system permease small subunit
MRILKWFYDNINRLVDLMLVVILSVMIVDVSVGVFYRYVLNNAIAWVEEVSRYLMIWSAYLSMGMVMRDEQNVGVEFIVNWFPPRGRRVIKVISHVVIGIFLFVVFTEAIKYTRILRIQRSPATGVPMIWPYLSVTAGAFLMLMENIKLLVEYATGKKTV